MHLEIQKAASAQEGAGTATAAAPALTLWFYGEPVDGIELDLGSSQGPSLLPVRLRVGRLLSKTAHLAGVNALNESLQ